MSNYVWVVETKVSRDWFPLARRTTGDRASARILAAELRRIGRNVRVVKYVRGSK